MTLSVGASPGPETPDNATPFIRQSDACPTAVEPTVLNMLRDLPTYANLVAARNLDPETPFGRVMVAGQPDFQPIDLQTFEPAAMASRDPDAVRQVFFTTLERQYVEDQSVLLQNYHWLFLTPGQQGWQMVLLYSSLGSYPSAGQPTTPPQNTSEGIIGQAVRLWLRDCRAGAVEILSPTVEPEGTDMEEGSPDGLPMETAPLDSEESGLEDPSSTDPVPSPPPDSIELKPGETGQ